MCEGVSDVDLIEVMGEATRDESTAIAQRLAAVAQLFVRRSAGRAMRFRPHRALAACADACLGRVVLPHSSSDQDLLRRLRRLGGQDPQIALPGSSLQRLPLLQQHHAAHCQVE
jgi:hypothetical protein